VAQERGLGQDLDVQERRGGLEGDRRQLLAPVELAWRVDVEDRDREDHPAREAADPPDNPAREPQYPPARDVVAEIDRREQRLEVRGRPWLDGRRDQHEGRQVPRERALQRLGQPRLAPLEGDDPALDIPPRLGQRVEDGSDDGSRRLVR
jgi:hypothetical protein